MIELFGNKTTAFLDLWSIEHILSGISIGAMVSFINYKYHNSLSPKTLVRIDIIAILFLAYLWESIEIYLELGLLGSQVEFWLNGIEHWSNRLISDPLMMLIGYFIGLNFPITIHPARTLSVIWLFVHIFIFPHSMYIHELF